MVTLNLYNGHLGLNLKSLNNNNKKDFWRRAKILCLKDPTFWYTLKVGARVAVCYQNWVFISKIIFIPDFYQTAILKRAPMCKVLLTSNYHDRLFSWLLSKWNGNLILATFLVFNIIFENFRKRQKILVLSFS